MDSSVTRKRMHVIFSGRVQGVGFRYTVCDIAAEYKVTGFIRNVWDGNVELVAEGLHDELMDLLHGILNSRLARNIYNNYVEWEQPTGEFHRFGILF
ncbi:MAG: acylphosphatase [Pontiella sp.]